MQVALTPRRRLGTFRLGETVAHQIPTGFWYVWQPDINLLDDEFLQIWNGEGGTYAACDRIYFAYVQPDGAWGQNGSPPDSFMEDEPNDDIRQNTWREANAWVGRAASEPSGYGPITCALSKVRDMNAYPTNPRAMRAVISRFLFGLRYSRDEDTGELVENWSLDRLKAYVGRICNRFQDGTAIGDADLRNACMG